MSENHTLSGNASGTPALRLRIFAGPNGSAKSTVIDSVRKKIVNGQPIDFGDYINADEIAKQLRNAPYDFSPLAIHITRKNFESFAISTGLIGEYYSIEELKAAYRISQNSIRLLDKSFLDQLAQLIARFLREQLFLMRKKFSFETVFSHESNLDIMRRAAEAGYKVYLYFVSTESHEINQFRVDVRVNEGGHYVSPQKIEKRYKKSLELLYEAAQIAYCAFFIDNSVEGEPMNNFASFKQTDGEKDWTAIDIGDMPEWFINYYLEKVPVQK